MPLPPLSLPLSTLATRGSIIYTIYIFRSVGNMNFLKTLLTRLIHVECSFYFPIHVGNIRFAVSLHWLCIRCAARFNHRTDPHFKSRIEHWTRWIISIQVSRRTPFDKTLFAIYFYMRNCPKFHGFIETKVDLLALRIEFIGTNAVEGGGDFESTHPSTHRAVKIANLNFHAKCNNRIICVA